MTAEALNDAQIAPKGRLGNVARFLYNATDLYYRPKSWERDGTIYEIFGVKAFRDNIPNFGRVASHLVYKITGRHPFINTRDDLHFFDKCTRAYETIHVAALVGIGGFMAGDISWGLTFGQSLRNWGMGIVAFNLLPIMIQRYNRGRVYRAIARGERLSKDPGE